MTDLSLICDVSQPQTSYNVHTYDNLQSFSHFEQVSTESYDFDSSYQDINGSQVVSSLYQNLEPTQLLPEFYYIEVPHVTATEFGGTTYYQYDYFYYPVYSTMPHSYASYDSVSTTVSSSTSYLEYSENISHSMELSSYTNTTEINYTDVQFSSSLYESNQLQNNSQIYRDNYYYDPNVGISGDSEFDNLTTVYNSSGLSGYLEASNIQNEIDPRAQLKYLKDRLYIIALSGKLRLKDSVPVVDVLPTIEEDVNFIEDDDSESQCSVPDRSIEVDEYISVESYDVNENLNDDNEIKVPDWTVEVEDETSVGTYDVNEILNVDNEIKVLDWTIEVEGETSEETYDVNENFNVDNEIKVLDWTIEVEEDYCKQGYDDNFLKAENSSSSNEIDKYDSKNVIEYHKEQLYIWALSGYMNLKDEVPVVDILPVIEEETGFLEDDRESDVTDEYKKKQPPDLLGSCEIRDRVREEPKSKDSIKDFAIIDLEATMEKTKHDETGYCFKAEESTRELTPCIQKNIIKSAESFEKIDLIRSSKSDYTNSNFSKEKEEIEQPPYEDPSIAPFYDVDLHQSDTNFYPESTRENEDNPSKVKKIRFENVRNWFRSLWCCVRSKPT